MLPLEKSAVVLLHGLYSTPDELLSLKGPLQRNGADVISFEIEGYTFDVNEKKPVSSPFEAWVLAVKNKVQSLKTEGFEKVFLVGISTGAALALASSLGAGNLAQAPALSIRAMAKMSVFFMKVSSVRQKPMKPGQQAPPGLQQSAVPGSCPP